MSSVHVLHRSRRLAHPLMGMVTVSVCIKGSMFNPKPLLSRYEINKYEAPICICTFHIYQKHVWYLWSLNGLVPHVAKPMHKLIHWPCYVIDVLCLCCQCPVVMACWLQQFDYFAAVPVANNVAVTGAVAVLLLPLGWWLLGLLCWRCKLWLILLLIALLLRWSCDSHGNSSLNSQWAVLLHVPDNPIVVAVDHH